MKGAPHGDVDGTSKPSHVSLIERLSFAVGGVADGDAEMSKTSDDLGHHFLNLLVVGHIGRHGDRLTAGIVDALHHLIGRFRVLPIVNSNLGASLGQGDRSGSPDSQARAGD